ncbi:hypothetical protein Li1_0470 [Lactococcus lactis subsp. lactis]|uniref:accessory Sec system protein Asp2 n=1 Tax=Lactococcus lactis TaxID=1358 RepID=UPI00071DEB06|nr:XcbB/CpsF family capsular polysaccharide biosynthesis protein [Lactococcus lactis]KSU08472.1 hypothetical protein Li1_0470 [Lactococcus lactis subsp. lactis]
MIKVLSFGCPATKDILDYNPFNNNRNYSLTYHKGYQAIPELNLLLDEIVPDSTNVVLFDFVSEAMFGTVYQNEKVTTRNFWIKNWGSEQVYTSTDFEATFGIWKKEVAKFIQYFLEKNIVLVLNSFRFSPEMVIDNENPQPTSKEYPTVEKQEYYNQFLQKAEKYVEEKFPQVKIIKFNQSSKVEKNHPIKAYSFYLNEDYYLDSFVQFETLIKERFPKEITDYKFYDLNENTNFENEIYDGSIILINYLYSGKGNILNAAWHHSEINDFLTKSSVNDYILDGQYGNIYRFIPRKSFYRKSLKEFTSSHNEKIFFSDVSDPIRLKSKRVKNIVFFFMGMPGGKTVNNANALFRLNPHLFNNFTRSLVKDTVVIRIADVNGVRGSFYVNSYNYSTYEDDLSEFLENMISTYNVDRDNVTLHGTSKGGVGALFYGSKHKLKSVSVDPVLDGDWVIKNQKNNHFVDGFRNKTDLVPTINNYLTDNKAETYVVGNHYVDNTWKILEKLVGVKLMDIDDSTVINHQQISPNCVPEWLMLINKMLLNL